MVSKALAEAVFLFGIARRVGISYVCGREPVPILPPRSVQRMSCEAVLALIPEAERQYSRLVLVAGRAGAGKSSTLGRVADALGSPVVNVGRCLSERLLSVRPRFRPIEVARQLDEILPDGGPAILDNTEILFEPALEQEPLQLLRSLARNRLVVAAWNGHVDDGHLTYGPSSHPAARRYRATGLLVVTLSGRPHEIR
jgi:hypothetical protein